MWSAVPLALVAAAVAAAGEARLYFEIEMEEDPQALAEELRALPVVHQVDSSRRCR